MTQIPLWCIASKAIITLVWRCRELHHHEYFNTEQNTNNTWKSALQDRYNINKSTNRIYNRSSAFISHIKFKLLLPLLEKLWSTKLYC